MTRRMPEAVFEANVAGLMKKYASQKVDKRKLPKNTPSRERVLILVRQTGDFKIAEAWIQATQEWERWDFEREVFEIQVEMPDVSEDVIRDYVGQARGLF